MVWLCLRRSVEVRAINIEAISKDGIVWQDGKDSSKPAILIQWTGALRATIDEALSIKRHGTTQSSYYIFGNMHGQPYTRGGWKTILHKLMVRCVAVAKERGVVFTPFNLQDCRPKGVSDKLSAGHTDTQVATGHTSQRMIQQVYDRRIVKKAKPVL